MSEENQCKPFASRFIIMYLLKKKLFCSALVSINLHVNHSQVTLLAIMYYLMVPKYLFNRPGVAGAFLQTPVSLIDSSEQKQRHITLMELHQ